MVQNWTQRIWIYTIKDKILSSTYRQSDSLMTMLKFASCTIDRGSMGDTKIGNTFR